MFDISGIGIVTAFTAGVVSFLSPCVLPLVPGYLSYIGGQSLEDIQNQELAREKLMILVLSLSFIFGFATVFIAFGASATAIGQLLLTYRYEANIVGGTIVVIFGLLIAGLLRFGWLHREFRFHSDHENVNGGRPLGAYILGLAFAFGWTPCIGPILGAILMVSATSNVAGNGIALLAIYSLGLGLPFIAAALFTNRFMRHTKHIRQHGRTLQRVAGGFMIVMGIAMITGYLSDFSWWLLDAFPVLGKIG